MRRSQPGYRRMSAFTSVVPYERWPMVLVRLDRVDPVELGELVEDSWRRRAPGRLVAARDAQGGAPHGAQGDAGPGGDMGSAGNAPGGAGPGPGPG